MNDGTGTCYYNRGLNLLDFTFLFVVCQFRQTEILIKKKRKERERSRNRRSRRKINN